MLTSCKVNLSNNLIKIKAFEHFHIIVKKTWLYIIPPEQAILLNIRLLEKRHERDDLQVGQIDG